MKINDWIKISMCFYYINKFKMKKSETYLFLTVHYWLMRSNILKEKFLLQIAN